MLRTRTTTVRDLRRSNRSRALWQIYLNGPLTRQEVGTLAGLSAATVSNLVVALEAEGIVAEVGLEESNGGRPRGLLQVNPGYGYVIGVDVGETEFLVELFDFGLNSREQHASVTHMAVLEPQDAVSHIVAGIESVIKSSGVDASAILGVGVAVPGLVEHAQDAVVHGQSIGWQSVPLGAMLRRSTGLPILVDNGAKALGQAERWFGAARSTDNVVIALLGIGAGACVISNGDLYRGATSSAGEWGHTTVAVGGRSCRCGAQGCLEAYIGAGAVAARHAELTGHRASDGTGGLEPLITSIVDARHRDPVAAQVLDEVVTYLGAGIADLVNLFNPERVVVGGWLGRLLSDELLPEIRAAAGRHALRLPFSHVEIVKAHLGEDAIALGGATLPIARVLSAEPLAQEPSGDRRHIQRLVGGPGAPPASRWILNWNALPGRGPEGSAHG
jgi:predicted NBD/HSP70 family sugar kinase